MDAPDGIITVSVVIAERTGGLGVVMATDDGREAGDADVVGTLCCDAIAS